MRFNRFNFVFLLSWFFIATNLWAAPGDPQNPGECGAAFDPKAAAALGPAGKDPAPRPLGKLVRNVLGLSPQEVIIDSVVHIGRSTELKDYQIRETPAAFKDAATIIVVQEPNGLVSRNHLLLYPPDELMATYSVLDLKSKNGTFVNGIKIKASVRVPLNPGDVIDLGGVEVMGVKRGSVYASARFTFSPLPNSALKHFAIMVGQPGWNLRGVENDLDQLGAELRARRFEVESLQNGAATEASIIDRLTMARRVLTSDSLLVFYFSGHGTENGDLVIGSGGQTISLARIFAEMQGLRGQKLVILDGCYTAATLDTLQIPPRTNIIGHTEKGYEGGIGSMELPVRDPADADAADPFADPPIMGFMTRALVKQLSANPHRVDVNSLVAAVLADPRIQKRDIGIGYAAHTVIGLPSVMGDEWEAPVAPKPEPPEK